MVSVKTAATSDEMVALMNEGGFDLVTASAMPRCASSPASASADQHGPHPLLEHHRRAPAERPLAHQGRRPLWHALRLGPERVDVQHQGLLGDKAPDSWNVVFEEMTLPDGKSNKGRIQAYDGPIHVADAANYLMFHKPELGIKDPYELNEDQYKAALDLLRVQRTLVSRYWHDAFIQIDDFKNEGVVASGSWPFQVNLLKADQPSPRSSRRKASPGWADTTMLHVDSEHPNCAYMWMEHSLSPKVQGDVSAWFGTVPSVPAACKGNALLGDEGCKNNGFENFEKIKFWKTPCLQMRKPGRMRPLPPLGLRLHRRHRRTFDLVTGAFALTLTLSP